MKMKYVMAGMCCLFASITHAYETTCTFNIEGENTRLVANDVSVKIEKTGETYTLKNDFIVVESLKANGSGYQNDSFIMDVAKDGLMQGIATSRMEEKGAVEVMGTCVNS